MGESGHGEVEDEVTSQHWVILPLFHGVTLAGVEGLWPGPDPHHPWIPDLTQHMHPAGL